MGLPTELARVTGRNLSPARLRPLLRHALEGEQVALCLHRVHEGPRRTGEKLPEMSLRASELDELIDRLRDAKPASLTVTFDDGYADAARYLLRRAEQLRDVQFIYFVCPRPTESREAFAWDVEERAGASADDAEFSLATVEQCRELARLGNVRLGNHSNGHHRLSELTSEELLAELTRSDADFRRLFGPALDFAIPFGTPGVAFTEREVSLLRGLGYSRIWSTEPRPWNRRDHSAGLLPRYAMDGTWSVGELVAWIAVRAVTSGLPLRRVA